jgi:hypothetical protein
MNLDYDPDPDLGGARFPPKVWPAEKDIAAAQARWKELGLDKPGQGHVGASSGRAAAKRAARRPKRSRA